MACANSSLWGLPACSSAAAGQPATRLTNSPAPTPLPTLTHPTPNTPPPSNPRPPQVVGALLDAEADESFVNNLILSIRSLVPVEALVAEVEARNKLKTLNPFLEQLVSEGSKDPAVHNALGKIIVDTNNNPEHFLTTNPYYDSEVVGRFAEKRDPSLACVAYKRGQCDDALVACTNKHAMFKLQARYVVERQEGELWDKVLDAEGNKHRRQLIDQVRGSRSEAGCGVGGGTRLPAGVAQQGGGCACNESRGLLLLTTVLPPFLLLLFPSPPSQPSPTQPNPTQPNPTQPNPTRPPQNTNRSCPRRFRSARTLSRCLWR